MSKYFFIVGYWTLVIIVSGALLFSLVRRREITIGCGRIELENDPPVNHVHCYNRMSTGEWHHAYYGCMWGREEGDYSIICKRATNILVFQPL